MHLDKTKLAAQLTRAELTIPQVAVKAGISVQRAYDLFERPHACNPTFKTAAALAAALNCKAAQLITE